FQRSVIADRLDFFQLGTTGEEDDPGSGVAQQERNLIGSEGGVDGDDDGTDGKRSIIGDRPLGTVLAENRNAIPFRDAPYLEGFRGSGNLAIEFARGEVDPSRTLAVGH